MSESKDADSVQVRIDKLEARIAELEKKVESIFAPPESIVIDLNNPPADWVPFSHFGKSLTNADLLRNDCAISTFTPARLGNNEHVISDGPAFHIADVGKAPIVQIEK